MNQAALDFDGLSFVREHDSARLTGQLLRVFTLMSDGRWRTLREIADRVGGSEAGISARLRDCRKSRFGCHNVQRRRRGDPKLGLYEYRILS